MSDDPQFTDIDAHAVASGARRYALAVEYRGSDFHGWQRQTLPQVPTVQQSLEEALSVVANHEIKLVCAGRTDAGVHAIGQIVHFDSSAKRSCDSWRRGANSHLPASIRVVWAECVDTEFHARFSALWRRYRYVIANTRERPAIHASMQTHCARPLDAELMHSEAQCLLGEQDFSSFRAVACQSRTPMRNVHHAKVCRRGQLVWIDIQANAFLLHMVRNIAGTLMAVGSGQQGEGWTKEVLQLRDRSAAAATARPDGLYLVEVGYPARWQFPQAYDREQQPWFYEY